MKSKNILKFISLLSVGSFVSLAVASCGQAANPNPGKPGDGDQTPPGQKTDAEKLAEAKMMLNTSLATKSAKVALYTDYAKIQNTLNDAYATAQAVSSKSNATLTEVENATTALKAEIDAAAKAKTDFDNANPDLVSAYANLKEAVKSKSDNLATLSNPNYATIKANLTTLYNNANEIIVDTLNPNSGIIPKVATVKSANDDIANAIEQLVKRKENADTLSNSFLKKTLDKQQLTNNTKSQQPVNYSFVGYNQNINDINYNFAKRIIWKPENNRTNIYVALENQDNLTDVSWIYSLSQEGAKYTFTFDNYGPSTAYLYFPYKLVKTENNFGLQYKLNGGENQQVEFKIAATSGSVSGTESRTEANSDASSTNTAESSSSTRTLVASNDTQTNEINPTPTVSDINVAKITLSNLLFGQNTIEFSVPTSKVSPMIGNMYLTSSISEINKNKIYDDIFGNTLNDQDGAEKSVTVDLLKGYSLAADHSTYFYQFINSNNAKENTPTYLVGFIGGGGEREVSRSVSVGIKNPSAALDERTLTIYVNAPEKGEYHIKGSYLTSNNRGLKFTTTTSETSSNSLTFTVKGKGNWTTLGNFDTAKGVDIQQTGSSSGAEKNATNTIKLNKGLNKIIIAGGTEDNTNAPYIGNLTFTLKNTTTETDSKK
ncbi:FIVAR domain-containing protein [[Mycoplasma] imitans]|uniref:FIVAR domain-containing protein n=1 Tax=[Mycoplasma] imitans TaxID=29560 RepID=UPI00047F5241|nr:FIVAR domain-containing protein [[Mycoplasma] imitans]